jgi:hypothetical protein
MLEVFVSTSILRTDGEKSENIHKLKLTVVRKYDFRGTTELRVDGGGHAGVKYKLA